MDKGGDDLFDYFCERPEATSMKVTKCIMESVAKAVNFLHSKRICHRDLKPENILFNEITGEVKLIDFGLAVSVGSAERMRVDFCGSPGFFAPEMLIVGKYDVFK